MPTTPQPIWLAERDGRIMQLYLRDNDGNDLVILDISGNINSPQGVCLLTTMSGLMHAPRTPTRETWAYQEGSTPSEFPRVDERIIDIRLATKGHTASAWEQIESLLWKVLGFRHDAYLRLYSADGVSWREIAVRLDRAPKEQMTYDSLMTKHMVWDVTLVACDPFWYLPPITSSWTNTNGSGVGTLTISNPSDQTAYLQYSGNQVQVAETWTLADGIQLYPVGHPQAGQPVTHTLPTLSPAVGGWFVNTHPLEPTLTVLDGSQQWAKMKAEDFLFGVPPHTPPTTIPVRLAGGTTASRVTVFVPQRYDRPFGGQTMTYDGPNGTVTI